MSTPHQTSASSIASQPLSKTEKTWGFMATFGNATSAAVATWSFVAGATMAAYLGAIAGSIMVFVGVLLGLFFVLLAALPISQRYGLESVRALRPTLGSRGSGFGVVLIFATLVGWNSVLAIVLMQSASSALNALNILPDNALGVSQILILVFTLIAVFLLVIPGARSLRFAAPIVTVAVLVLGLIMMGFIIWTFGLDRIMSAEPLSPSKNSKTNVMTIIELGVASGLSWWPYLGSITRNSRSTKTAIIPSVLGFGLIMSLVASIGLIATLVAPESEGNPVSVIIAAGGPLLGLVGLLFLFFANVGTILVGTYTSVLAVCQVSAINRRIGWRWMTVLTLLPILVVSVFFGESFLAAYPTFLAFSGVLMGPICGVQIIDYFLVRRQQLDARSLYSDDGRGAYWYLAGFNLVGFVAIIAGIASFFIFFDPFSYVPNFGFNFLGASIPATIISAILYAIGARSIPSIWKSRDQVSVYQRVSTGKHDSFSEKGA